MSGERELIRTSLEVGFGAGFIPEQLVRYRGRLTRAIPHTSSYPFEDAQFDVVLMEGSGLTPEAIREAHRVLVPKIGRLFFIVPEKTRSQPGWTVSDVYAFVRNGFDIVGVERPSWWLFGRKGHTLTIQARKKTWKAYQGLSHDTSVPIAPFRRSPL